MLEREHNCLLKIARRESKVVIEYNSGRRYREGSCGGQAFRYTPPGMFQSLLNLFRPHRFGDRERTSRAETEIEEGEVDLYNPFPDPITIEITDVFDLHSIPPREVKRVVIEYLNEAHRAGFQSIRIIHGKGIGVQREIVRKILVETSFVISFTDAPPEAGGWGATVARLSSR